MFVSPFLCGNTTKRASYDQQRTVVYNIQTLGETKRSESTQNVFIHSALDVNHNMTFLS